MVEVETKSLLPKIGSVILHSDHLIIRLSSVVAKGSYSLPVINHECLIIILNCRLLGHLVIREFSINYSVLIEK